MKPSVSENEQGQIVNNIEGTWREPVAQWWGGVIFLVSLISGLSGVSLANIVCSKICKEPIQDEVLWIPGYQESVLQGSIFAGVLTSLLIIAAHYLFFRPLIVKKSWVSVATLSVILIPISTLLITRIHSVPTDVFDPVADLLIIGGAILLAAIASVSITYSFSRSLNFKSKREWIRNNAFAWTWGWAVFGLAGFWGYPIVIVLGWLLGWLVVGLLVTTPWKGSLVNLFK